VPARGSSPARANWRRAVPRMQIIFEVFLLQKMIFHRIARDTGDFADNDD
jgi:hypothetical protein